MIIKTVDQLKQYLVDGGDPERISIKQTPLKTIPTPVFYKNEGRHLTSTYSHNWNDLYIRKRWYK